jgi:hypothetical protein
VVFVVSLAAIVGCGDSSEEQVDAAELVQRGDEICRADQERFAAIQKEPPANASQAADQTDEVIDSSTEAIDDLRDLKPPSELSHKYEAYLTAREDALDLIEEGRDALDNEDTDAYGAAQTKLSDGAEGRAKLARAIGFKDCSNPQSASSITGSR